LITSPFVRAAQTAEIFAEAIGYAPDKIRVSENLKPSENPAEIVKELQRLKVKEVMCFGHAPHVDLWISQLAGAREPSRPQKGGVACFEHQSVHGKWELLCSVTPKFCGRWVTKRFAAEGRGRCYGVSPLKAGSPNDPGRVLG